MRLLCILACLTASTLAGQEARQEWLGTLDLGGRKVNFRLATVQNGGKWTARIQQLVPSGDSPEMPVDTFEVDGGNVSLKINRLNAEFSGKLNEASDQVTGMWKQTMRSGDIENLPLTLRLADPSKEPRLIEAWTGDLKLGPQNLTLRFRVLESPAGKRLVKFDSLSDQIFGLAAEANVAQGQVDFAVPLLKASFKGLSLIHI